MSLKKLNPIEQSNYIGKAFREYVKSTFEIDDDSYNSEFNRELENAELCKGPFISSELPFEKTHSIRELIELGELSKEFLNLSKIDFDQKLYYHQEKALKTIILLLILLQFQTLIMQSKFLLIVVIPVHLQKGTVVQIPR